MKLAVNNAGKQVKMTRNELKWYFIGWMMGVFGSMLGNLIFWVWDA